jgi:TATA-binding protein-associated factor
VFVLDRFGDFVSDQVVAPVRETVSQTLASLLLHMPRRSVLHVHSILLQMIRQDFPLPVKPTNGKQLGRSKDTTHVWEVRHAGLLGIKYEVAVRSDLVEASAKPCGEVKIEDEAPSEGRMVLQGVVDAAILGYVPPRRMNYPLIRNDRLGDQDDDVRSVAASCLLPVAQQVVEQIPEALPQVLSVLWHCLAEIKDDLSSSVSAVMDLLGKVLSLRRVHFC